MTAGDHLLKLIDDVLNLSRIENNISSLNIEPVDAIKICSECNEMLRAIIEKEQLNLRMLKNAIFKEENFINTIAIKSSTPSGTKTAHKNKTIIKTKDYINVYKKNNDIELEPQYVSREKWDNHYSLYLEKINGEYTFFKLIDKLAEAGYQYNKLEDINPQDESIRKFIVENQEKIIRLQSHKNKELDLISREQYPDKVYEHIVDNELRGLYFNGQVVTQIKQGIKEIIVNKKLKPYWSILLCDFWNDLDFQNTQNQGNVNFENAKKPEQLLYRIIDMVTNNNDIVMDFNLGSGTTCAVAHKMGRRWIMVELGEHCHTHVIPRLQKVIDGEDKGGVTESTGWQGGGGFRYYKLAPSLMKKDQWDNWVINPEYNQEMLVEAMCKLEGYTYTPSETEYWNHGKGSETDFIYVTTQTLTDQQLQAISEEVGEGRTLLIIASAWRSKNIDRFTNLTLKKIPNSIIKACEWGHDDYSLNVQNLPISEPDIEEKPKAKKVKNTQEQSQVTGDLFGDQT